MALRRADYDQAARYLAYACKLLAHQAFGNVGAIRQALRQTIRRLSPGDEFTSNAAAEVTVLRDIAAKVLAADARTEILKAIAVLQDRSG